MKRRTRAQEFDDIADAVKAIREGKPVKRIGRRDRSIPTHPIVPVLADVPEKDVLAGCISWLRKNRITCWRHDSGTFQNVRGQWGTYGIKGAGDIIGLLPKDGRHFEIETKHSNGGRLSSGQQKRMRDVRESNGIYLVIHGVAELRHLLGSYL